MRCVFSRAIRGGGALWSLFGLVLCCAAPAAAGSARAATYSIDPDPRSATLGEVIDENVRKNGPRPALKPVRAEPMRDGAPREAPLAQAPGPQKAVTVLIPHGKVPGERKPPR